MLRSWLLFLACSFYSLLAPLADAQPSPSLPVSYPVTGDGSEERARIALGKPISFDWKGVPLKEVIRQIADECDVTMVLRKDVEDAGITPNQLITEKLVKTPLRNALRLILGKLNLMYMIRDDMLWITAVGDHPPVNLETRVYPVRDLVNSLTPLKGAAPAWDFEPLIALIQDIETDSWLSVGGSGTIKRFDNGVCLVVTQRDDVHERIGGLLLTLRRVKKVQGLELPAVHAIPNRYLPGNSALNE